MICRVFLQVGHTYYSRSYSSAYIRHAVDPAEFVFGLYTVNNQLTKRFLFESVRL